MQIRSSWLVKCAALAVAVSLLGGCGFRRKKYDNPITKDTQQPDKVLFDKAVSEIERSRFEVARLLLQNLMNTYDTSEFMAKAKLAYADSFYREGGSHGLAQAEAEYKDFILFYPNMEEAAEAQMKVCQIHYKQMEKPDRDITQANRAEDECRQLLVQFPNSKFAPQVTQYLRNVQEVLAEGEYRVGSYYHTKGSHPAAANRLQTMTDHYPLYSQNDAALMALAEDYMSMGGRFRPKAGEAYSRILREYPLSKFADEAKKQLAKLEMPIPEADAKAAELMKYNLEHRDKGRMTDPVMGILKGSPNTKVAAKAGQPAMQSLRPSVPVSVPPPNTGTPGSNEVVGGIVTDSTALDTKPDARMNQPKGDQAQAATTDKPAAADPLPSNYQNRQAKQKKGKKAQQQPAQTPAQQPQQQ